MAAARAQVVTTHLPPPPFPSASPTTTSFRFISRPRPPPAATARARARCSRKPADAAEEQQQQQELPLQDDFDYLGKLALGSVGGAAAIKYGSILFLDLTRPNIVQALFMVSLPVAVAVIILLKESFAGGRNEESV